MKAHTLVYTREGVPTMNSIDRCLARSGAAIVTVMLGSAVCHAQTNQTQGSDQSTTAKTAIAANKTRPGTPSTKASGSKASKSATGATDDSPKAMEYDPKMAKSADLRRPVVFSFFRFWCHIIGR